jgi:hypothetical protein
MFMKHCELCMACPLPIKKNDKSHKQNTNNMKNEFKGSLKGMGWLLWAWVEGDTTE